MTTVDNDGTVEFWFYRKGASQVRVVGDFPGWRGGEREMEAGTDGWWHLNAAFDPGEYRFRYAADGEWFPDYASNGIEMGEAGVCTVLVVPELRFGATRLERAKQERSKFQLAKLVA